MNGLSLLLSSLAASARQKQYGGKFPFEDHPHTLYAQNFTRNRLSTAADVFSEQSMPRVERFFGRLLMS